MVAWGPISIRNSPGIVKPPLVGEGASPSWSEPSGRPCSARPQGADRFSCSGRVTGHRFSGGFRRPPPLPLPPQSGPFGQTSTLPAGGGDGGGGLAVPRLKPWPATRPRSRGLLHGACPGCSRLNGARPGCFRSPGLCSPASGCPHGPAGTERPTSYAPPKRLCTWSANCRRHTSTCRYAGGNGSVTGTTGVSPVEFAPGLRPDRRDACRTTPRK